MKALLVPLFFTLLINLELKMRIPFSILNATLKTPFSNRPRTSD
jgi:hypothetical protein